MKRILAILCVIAVLCGLCVPAMAAGTITVSVKSSWSQVNLYVWENDTPMEGWPGTAMTKGADGWWTLTIPAGSYTNVIANDGSNQTADLKMDGSADCWIDADAGVVYTDKACTTPFGGGNAGNGGNAGGPVDLSGLNSLALAGEGMPGFVEGWNPGAPAGEMTKESNGVYTKVVTVLAGTAAMFKIAGNDEWNDAYNLGCAEKGTPVVLGTKMDLVNGGGSQDIALNVDKDCNLKFTVDLTGDVPTLLVEETTEEPSDEVPTPPPSTDKGETYTLYAAVPEDWKNPCIWCWDGNSQNPSDLGSWPGSYAMTKGSDGWWTIEIPVGYTNVLINANSGGVQTIDITGLTGQDVWIDALTNTAQPTVAYSGSDYPAAPETEPPTTGAGRETIKPNLNGDGEGKIDWVATIVYSLIGMAAVIAVAVVVTVVILVITKASKKKA